MLPVKRCLYLLGLATSIAIALPACGGGGGGNSGGDGDGGGGSTAYPDAADRYEGAGGDNTKATASAIAVGDSQIRTLWPTGDVDFIAVSLLAGTEYEFSAHRLCATCDTLMRLYDTTDTVKQNNDDYLGLDSRFRYTPPVDGIYMIEVRPKQPQDVAQYTLSVREWADSDGDGASSFYDCDDNNPVIYPGATEIAGDGIDQNCSGTDKLASTTADPAEPDNSPATAEPMYMTGLGVGEIQYQQAGWAANARTIHTPGDEDYFHFTLGPKEAAHVQLYEPADASLTATLYDSDGTTAIAPLDGNLSGGAPWLKVANTTDADKTFYISYTAAASTWYVPALFSAGVDNDGDGFYTRDFALARDCDDSDPAINPLAAEIPGDGIDQDCNPSSI